MKPSAYYAEGVALQIRSFHYGHVLNIFGYPVHILAGIECTGVKEAKVLSDAAQNLNLSPEGCLVSASIALAPVTLRYDCSSHTNRLQYYEHERACADWFQ